MLIVTNVIKKNLLAILITMLLLHLVGCKDLKNCISDETALVKVKFKITTQRADGSTQVQDAPIPFVSIGVSGLQPALQDVFKSASVAELPLNPNADTTTFIFYKTGSLPDTLTFFYKRTVFLVSPQCGAGQYYTLLDVKTTFPNFKIVKTNLKRFTKQPNVEIFL